MNLQALSSHPKLKKLIRECDKGDLLFSEGDPANTVFLVLEGCLELSIKQQNKQIRIGKVNSGEFIGERALLQEEPFNRKASATALSQTFLLELGPDHFSQLEKEAVGVYLLLLKKAFKTLISRNEALEEFGEALKSYDPRRRFLSYLLLKSQSKKTELESFEIYLEPAQLALILNCKESSCSQWIKSLEASGCLKATSSQSGWNINFEQLQAVGVEALEMPQAA